MVANVPASTRNRDGTLDLGGGVVGVGVGEKYLGQERKGVSSTIL